ncbi:hypothetical protein P3G55_23845 [Leptospira sp. 96542]|nr:hypothetical protein [Leptospira sp. 96542]
MTQLGQALLSTQTPVLPGPLAVSLYLSLSWGVVLACLARHAVRGKRGAVLALALLLLCLLPGTVSPAYWLGLTFRAPSALLCVLCLWGMWRHGRQGWQSSASGPMLAAWPALVLGALVVLGWVLLLDTLALLPLDGSVYAWGFAPLVTGLLVLLSTWAAFAGSGRGRGATWAWLLLAAVLSHAVLRLPTGNVWDAVLDPVLWFWLQWQALRRLRPAQTPSLSRRL